MTLELEKTEWSIARGQTEEYEFDVRFRTFHIKPLVEAYGTRLNIFWKASEVFDNGYPKESELELMHEFENYLVDAVEYDEFSIMPLVLTGNGEREFVFYTKDSSEFINRITNMPQKEEPYPIEIHASDDPGWSYYHEEVDGITGA